MVEYTKLGRTEIKISKIGIGTWQWGSSEWGWGKGYTKEDLRRAFEKAVDIGINFIDTAEIYGGGKSEKMLGEFIKGRREDLVIATKVWPTHLRFKSVLKACERSLQRLNTNYIDLYQVHWPNPLIPMKSTAKAMDFLINSGKIRAVGVSNFNLKKMIKFDKLLTANLASNQVRYGLLHRAVEKDLLPFCVANSITLIAYSPLDRGAISGKYNEKNLPKDLVRRISFVFTPPNMKKVQALIRKLKEIAEHHGVEIVNVALRYLIQKGAVPIVGIKHEGHVESISKTFDFSLSDKELSELSITLSKIKISKARVFPWIVARIIHP
ncbi:MAG: aldo/keto reductase [Candidatus Asgardarchaeia archaeon]